MKIRVLLFAGVQERAGVDRVALDDLDEGASAQAVLQRLTERWPFLAGYPVALARNCEVVEPGTVLEDGDELALLPPVSGG